MKSYRKTILIAVVVGVVAAAVSYETTPRTPESCRAFREQLKQLALSDSGLAGVIVNAPENLLDDALDQRYGKMKPEQCEADKADLTAEQEAYTHTAWAPRMRQAGEEAGVAVAQCRDKRVGGELKTHADSAQCSNPEITAAFTRAGYPYMDLVKQLTDTRLAEAQKLDKSLLGGTENQAVFADLAFQLTDEERQRIGKAIPPQKH